VLAVSAGAAIALIAALVYLIALGLARLRQLRWERPVAEPIRRLETP